MPETNRQRLLQLAVKRIGKEKLAKLLNSPPHLLETWISGFATMPDRKMLELAKIIEDLGDDDLNDPRQ
jgi:hypothetical protein